MSTSPLAGCELSQDALGRLCLTLPGGQRHEAIHPVRAFPLAQPDGHISLVGSDGVS